MELRVDKALFHPHFLDSQNQFLTDKEMFVRNNSELINQIEDYLIKIIRYNSRKSSGQLADFKLVNAKNKFMNLVTDIIQDPDDFVKLTQRIMQDLIFAYTPGTSTPGNFLFTLYQFDGDEKYLNQAGQFVDLSVNELRFGMLKFELTDTRFIDYVTDEHGNRVSNIVFQPEKGLPQAKETVKKAVFVNNLIEKNVEYNLRVIDKESPNIAKFFTNEILACNYVARPQHYLPRLRNETNSYFNKLKDGGRITLEQHTEVINRFESMIKVDTTIDQTQMGTALLRNIIDEEELIQEVDSDLLERYHEKGLAVNVYKLSEADVEQFYQNQVIRFSKRGYLKFSEEDIKKQTVVLPEAKDENTNKYRIEVFVDKYPKSMIRDKQ